jgi:aminoglycoside phosphotransferase (APT) family kinase protein
MTSVDPLTEQLAPAAALCRWLSPLVDLDEGLHVERLQVGRSQEVFRLTSGSSTWLLRRPSRITNDSGSTTAREHRLLAALAGSPVPHAAVLAYCSDVAVIGAPFLVLEWIEGFAPRIPLPTPFDTKVMARREMCFSLVDALATLADFDWRDAGLEGFGRPEGFLERQVARWLSLLDRNRTRDLPVAREVGAWLSANRPAEHPARLMHGDYTWTNVMFAPDPPGRVRAIVDWEQSTVGDPLLDIGYLTGLWYEPGEDAGGRDPAGLFCQLPGNPARDELLEQYSRKTRYDLTHIRYYQALAMFKLACILERTWARYDAGDSDDPEHARLEHRVPALLERAATFAGLR